MLVEIQRFINWIQMRSPQARTWRDYRCDLDLFMKVAGSRSSEKMRPRDIDDFVNFQVNKGYKPSTINRRLAAVVSFYRFLITQGKAVTCPILPKRHYLRESQRLPRPLNEQDLRRFFGAIQDVRDRAMFTLMLRCGLRIGEVSDLQMSDLYLGESPSRLIIRGKGARERTVYLSSETERTLQKWLEKRAEARDKHVFLSYQHRKLSTTSINVRIKHVRKRSGVELTAHRHRHTFADHLLSAGMPITSIQKLMGHRFVETTQNYAVANDKQVQADFYKACQKLEGWKLLIDATEVDDRKNDAVVEMEAESGQEDDASAESVNSAEIPIPGRISRLPAQLARQLEAYRQLKANRWRMERIMANSLLFYSQQGILWEFLCGNCAVQAIQELRLENVLQFVKARLDAKRSARTVNGSLSSLRSFLAFLMENGVEIHPSLENIQRLKESERLPRYMTSEQVRQLRDEVEGNVSCAVGPSQRYDALLLRAVFVSNANAWMKS